MLRFSINATWKGHVADTTLERHECQVPRFCCQARGQLRSFLGGHLQRSRLSDREHQELAFLRTVNSVGSYDSALVTVSTSSGTVRKTSTLRRNRDRPTTQLLRHPPHQQDCSADSRVEWWTWRESNPRPKNLRLASYRAYLRGARLRASTTHSTLERDNLFRLAGLPSLH